MNERLRINKVHRRKNTLLQVSPFPGFQTRYWQCMSSVSLWTSVAVLQHQLQCWKGTIPQICCDWSVRSSLCIWFGLLRTFYTEIVAVFFKCHPVSWYWKAGGRGRSAGNQLTLNKNNKHMNIRLLLTFYFFTFKAAASVGGRQKVS